MSFCTQCGKPIAANARFCGKCGAELNKQETNHTPEPTQEQVPAATNNGVNKLQSSGSNLHRKRQKYDKKIIGGLIAIALIIGFYMFTPKQLTEQEYEDLVIELLVRDELAMNNFSDEIEYSGIHVGLDPVWSEDYKQLIEPAKTLEKEFGNLNETLKDVKPPEYFEYEHETLLKVFNAHKNMGSNLVSYLADGDEEYMESWEEYESRAEDYLEESIFLTEEYEDQIMQVYEKTRLD